MEPWSQVRIFHKGDEYFESMFEAIRDAKKSIVIEGYIFAVDRLTRPLLDELANARNRGCSVKLITDGFGSYNYIPELKKICDSKGIEMRVFHPFPYFSKENNFLRLKNANLFNIRIFFRRLNRRNHRKITLIDDQKAYFGSLNFIEYHCAQFVGSSAWRDTGVCVQGPAVKHLVLTVQITYLRTIYRGILTWVSRWMLPRASFSESLHLNTTQKMRRALYRDLLRAINQAEKRIYITTAYFLPKRKLLKALIKASERGVDVRLLLPGKSDVPLVKWAAFNTVRMLTQSHIPIYEYQGSILHAKTMILDNTVYIGSFNLNHRSLLHDLEIIALFQDHESLNNMLEQWALDLEKSHQVKDSDFDSSPVLRWFYRLAFLLRYML